MLDDPIASGLAADPGASWFDPAYWQQWARSTDDLARRWAVLLAGDMPADSPEARQQLRLELMAYARRLLDLRLHARGLILKPVSTADPEEPPAALTAAAPVNASAVTGSIADASAGFNGGGLMPVSQATPQRCSPRLSVSPAMFERFCRLSGMDPGCLNGTPEHTAGLILYVIVFALLTGEEARPSVMTQRLLGRLRLCREQFVAHANQIEAWVDNPARRGSAMPRLGLDPRE
jgi:hypothetical protein